jgi:hypothetical protein
MKCTQAIYLLPLIAVLFSFSCAPHGQPKYRGEDDTDPRKDPGVIKKPVKVPDSFKAKIELALHNIATRELLITHSFWTVLHGILGSGLDATCYDPRRKKHVNAMEYIARGGPIRGMRFIPMEIPGEERRGLDVQMGPMFVGQGHQDQFVAEMLQCGLPPEYRFIVNGVKYNFADFFRYSKARASVTGDQELSWTVVIVGQYYGSSLAVTSSCVTTAAAMPVIDQEFGLNYSWENRVGEKLSLEKVIRYELDQPIEKGACGGTHRLFGLTWVYHLHLLRGGKTTGVWKDVAQKIETYKKKARELQNSDGTMSTEFFNGWAHARNVQLRINTTGHIVEWLSLAMSDEELKSEWMKKAVNALVMLILENQKTALDSGGLYHAGHGLHIYHDRMFGPMKGHRGPVIPLPPKE